MVIPSEGANDTINDGSDRGRERVSVDITEQYRPPPTSSVSSYGSGSGYSRQPDQLLLRRAINEDLNDKQLEKFNLARGFGTKQRPRAAWKKLNEARQKGKLRDLFGQDSVSSAESEVVEEPVSVCVMNLGDSAKPIKTLKKTFEAAGCKCTAVPIAHLRGGNAEEVESFNNDDLLVIDFGCNWGNYADLSIRVGQRHSDFDDSSKDGGKMKKTIILFQADDMQSFNTSDPSFVIRHQRSTSSRIPYVKSGSNLLVLYKGESEDSAEGAESGSASWIALKEFYNNLLLNVTAIKNRRISVADAGIHKVQSRFDGKLERARARSGTNEERRIGLAEIESYIKENSNLIFTENNLLRLLRSFRDVKAWDNMISLIRFREAQFDVHKSNHPSLSAESQYFLALALWSRKGPGDIELAKQTVIELCEREPNYMDAQGLKGKMFKNEFMHQFLSNSSSLDEKETMSQTWELAVQAYSKLSILERAKPNKIPSWSFSNLTVLLFAGENAEESKFRIWQSTDTLTQMMVADLENKKLSFWDSATMLSMDVIAGYLFQNPLLFNHANSVVAHLMTHHPETWMLETLLVDLRFIHNVNQRRSGDTTRTTSIEEQRFNYWHDFLEASVQSTAVTPFNSRKKQLVLVSKANTMGLEDYSKMNQMFISFEEARQNQRLQPGGSEGSPAPRASRVSSAGRGLGGGLGGRSSGGVRRSVSNTGGLPLLAGASVPAPQYIVQITPAISGDEGRQIEAKLKFVDIQNSDIPISNQPGVLDRRRLILSSEVNATGINEIFTVIFPSDAERQAFWDLAKSHGYTDKRENAEMSCPDYVYKLLNPDDPNSQRVNLGEGSFATVYMGETIGDEVPRVVAIKRIKDEFLSVPHAMADFLSEIGKLRAMKHRNIIEFLGSKRENGVLNTYLMELIDGGSLSQMVDIYGSIFVSSRPNESMAALAAYAAQILSGVEYLHTKQSICHRDVKPGNALVDSGTGTLKLTDFGTVKDIGGLDSSSVDLVGSLIYADPQVLMCVEYGLEVDIYSIGSTVWELASGKIPYLELSGMDVRHERMANPKRTLELDPEWPEELKNFLQLCWSPKSERPTAEKLKDHKFILSGIDVAICWEEDPLSGLTHRDGVSNQLSDALENLKEDILESWSQSLSITTTETGLANKYTKEMISLLDFIKGVLDSNVRNDPVKSREIWSTLSKLLQAANGDQAEEVFTRARDFVVILRNLEIIKPPVTPEASVEARTATHFLMDYLKTTEFFSSRPHTVFQCESCLNETVQKTIRDILPAASMNRDQRKDDDPEDDGVISTGTARAIFDKLDEVLDNLQMRNMATPAIHNFDDIPGDLLDLLKEKQINSKYGILLTNSEISAADLKRTPPMFTREELRGIGLPLGVVAKLQPLH